jgi:iron(III) transport system substrate-binding protein
MVLMCVLDGEVVMRLKGIGRREGRPGWRPVLGVPIVALALVLVGCSAGSGTATPSASSSAPSTVGAGAAPASLVAAAKAGGPINLYTSVDPTTAASLGAAFQKAYGIPVTVTRLVSGPIVARYTAEATAGNPVADVVIVADEPFFADGLSKGWFLPMTAKEVPNVANVPKTFQFDGSVGVGTSRLNGLAVNTGIVSKSATPTTWNELLAAKWKGKLVTDDPRTIPVVLAQWVALDKKLGDGYLKKMATQQVEWAPSLVTGVQEVAAGEKDIAFGINQGHVSPLLATAPSAPVTQPIVLLKPVDLGFAWNGGVSKKSANPAGGRLFIDWLLTKQGQELFNGATDSPSVLPSVTIPNAAPIGPNFVNLGEATSPAEQTRILGLLGLNQ